MQTLQRELKNVPMDTSLVCSSISCELNREKTLSAHGKVLICNNPEVNLQVADPERKVIKTVFVRSINNEPLMPCTPTKARRMLKKGEAYNEEN